MESYVTYAARSERTGPETLGVLSGVSDPRVRELVARNPSTSPDVLHRLAADEVPTIRSSVAVNPSTSLDTLVLLAGDETRIVQVVAQRNPRLPLRALHEVRVGEHPMRVWENHLVEHPHWEVFSALIPTWQGTLRDLLDTPTLLGV